jgi:hypothetical protein
MIRSGKNQYKKRRIYGNTAGSAVNLKIFFLAGVPAATAIVFLIVPGQPCPAGSNAS